MGLVMGIPFVYYLKRDMAYIETKWPSEEERLKAWDHR